MFYTTKFIAIRTLYYLSLGYLKNSHKPFFSHPQQQRQHTKQRPVIIVTWGVPASHNHFCFTAGLFVLRASRQHRIRAAYGIPFLIDPCGDLRREEGRN